MGHARSSEWHDGLLAFQEWFIEACDQVAEIESGEEPPELSPEFWTGVFDIARWCHEHTSIDPTPVWRLYWALDQCHRELSPDEQRKEHPPGHLASLLDGVDALRRRLHWPGVVAANRIGANGQFQLEVDRQARVIRRGETLKPFGKKAESWELFVALYDAGDAGCIFEDLLARLWPGTAERNARESINKVKPILNGLLADLHLAADTNSRGVWRLAETPPG